MADDKKFMLELRQCLNETDIKTIITNFLKPTENANLSRKTGRVRIGVPAVRPRKLLKPASLNNYRSIISKFAKFKLAIVGRMASINAETAHRYEQEVLYSGDLKFETIKTNVRILNTYVIIPILNQEIGAPRAIGTLALTNKPQLTHDEVSETLKLIWHTCKNRDHVHKMYLIYYTGLRSAEAEDLTYKDILDACSSEAIVLRVKNGKGKCARNVFLFQGAPTKYFRKHLISYLSIKMKKIISQRGNGKVCDNLNKKIFDTSYQSSLKVFRKALRATVAPQNKSAVHDGYRDRDRDRVTDENNNSSLTDENNNYNHNNNCIQDQNQDQDQDQDQEVDRDQDKINEFNDIKGAGLHSLRSDFSTRALKTLWNMSNDYNLSLKTVANLLGHTDPRNIYAHYVSLGYNFNKPKSDEEVGSNTRNGCEEVADAPTCTQSRTRSRSRSRSPTPPQTHTRGHDHDHDPENTVFKGVVWGSNAVAALQNRKRSHANVRNIIHVSDSNDIVPLEIPTGNKNQKLNHVFINDPVSENNEENNVLYKFSRL